MDKVNDSEPKQQFQSRAWARRWRHWNLLIYSYVVVVPLSYYCGRILSSHATTTTTTTTTNGSRSTMMTLLPTNNLEMFVPTSTNCRQPQGIDYHTSTTSSLPVRNPPIFIDTLSLPRFMATRVLKRRNAFTGGDDAVMCHKNGINNSLALDIQAEMFIQPAMLIHPNPRLVAIYIESACPIKMMIRAMLQQLQFFSTTLDQVYIFSHDDGSHDDDLLLRDELSFRSTRKEQFGLAIDSNLTVHVRHYSSTMLPQSNHVEDSPTNQQNHVNFDLVFLHREMMGQEESSSLGPTFWANHLDPKNGILVMPLSGHTYHDRIQSLVEFGRGHFAKVTDYESYHYHSTTTNLLHFAIAFKARTTYAHWHLNEAEYMVRMHKRNISYEALHILDGATMTTLAFPSGKATRAYCEFKYWNDCDQMDLSSGVDPFQNNIPYSHLEIKPSSLGKVAGRGVFTKVDAPQGTYFDLETSSQSIQASWTTTDLMFPFKPQLNSVFGITGKPLRHYFDGYGFYDEPFGEVSSFVDSGILTFPNHGCNSTYNVGRVLSVNEFTVALGQPPPEDFFRSHQRSPYDPLEERHALFHKVMTQSLRDIVAGEELFDNYLFFGGATYFHEVAQALRDQCRGRAGEIEEFQREKSRKNQNGSK